MGLGGGGTQCCRTGPFSCGSAVSPCRQRHDSAELLEHPAGVRSTAWWCQAMPFSFIQPIGIVMGTQILCVTIYPKT